MRHTPQTTPTTNDELISSSYASPDDTNSITYTPGISEFCDSELAGIAPALAYGGVHTFPPLPNIPDKAELTPTLSGNSVKSIIAYKLELSVTATI